MPLINDYPFQGEQYKVLFESNPFPMWIYDLDTLKFLAVNHAAIVKYGYSENEFSKMDLLDIRPHEDVESLLNNIKTKYEEYQWSSGWRHIKKDGTVINVEILSHQISYNNRKARLVVVNDVTEKIKTDAALKEAEERYRTTLDNMLEGFQIISFDWKYLYVNDSATIHGRTSKDELLNHTITEKYPGIENTELFKALNKCMKNRVPESMENEFTYPDGKKSWFYLRIEPVPEGILIHSTDITQDKIAQLEILRLDRVYRVLSSINQSIVHIKDEQLLFDTVSKIAIREGQFIIADFALIDENSGSLNLVSPSAKYEGQWDDTSNPFNFLHEEAMKVIQSNHYLIFNNIPEQFNNNKPFIEYSLRYGLNSNIIFPVKVFDKIIGVFSLFSGEKNSFENKEILLLEEMVQDVSFALETFQAENFRFQFESKLIESEKRFFNAFEYASIGMALVSPEGNFFRVNPALCNIVGYSKDELLNTHISAITHPDDIGADLEQINRMVNKIINNYIREKRYIHKSGREVWVLLNSSLLRDNNDAPLYFIAQIQDITTRKKAENELIIAKVKAEEMSKLKSNFLANMSHELRTPMVGIMGAVELLKESDDIEEVHSFIGLFEDSIKRLLRTLNQILDISKIEAGDMTIYKKDILVDKVIQKVAAIYKPEIDKKNLYLNLDIPQDRIVLNVDEDLFINIMNNLVNNAIKFTKSGGISIKVSKKKIKDSWFAQIIVNDTGIGIPADKFYLIYEPFRQVSEGFSRHHEGTGLGLTLVKKYTEMMDGNIIFESKLGKGSSFILYFPIFNENFTLNEKIEIDSNELTSKNENASLVKTLYIDDDETAHRLVKHFLRNICEVNTATSGEEGIILINQDNYDIIFIDIDLDSGMSGIETAEEIRKLNNYNKSPLVAITGYAMAGDEDKLLKSGFDYYISKPFSGIQLFNLVNQIIKQIPPENLK